MMNHGFSIFDTANCGGCCGILSLLMQNSLFGMVLAGGGAAHSCSHMAASFGVSCSFFEQSFAETTVANAIVGFGVLTKSGK